MEIKNTWSYNSDPSYVFMVWLLIKHTDKVVFSVPINYRHDTGYLIAVNT